jgi:hypothetical protein
MSFDSITQFCIVVYGDLGKAGIISLRSILNLPNSRICAMTDQQGKSWIELNLGNKGKDICYHTVKSSNLVFSLKSNGYANFGTENFAHVMTLKWTLIKESLLENDNLGLVIYTDLDIYWRKVPDKNLAFFTDTHKFAAFQDDSNQFGTKFCAGIMIWKNLEYSIILLDELQNYNYELLKINPKITDENALNNLCRTKLGFDYFMSLPGNDFVIGHKLLHLLLKIKPFNFKSFTAFHANYCIGLEQKDALLKIASRKSPNLLRNIMDIIIVIRIKILNRLEHKSK